MQDALSRPSSQVGFGERETLSPSLIPVQVSCHPLCGLILLVLLVQHPAQPNTHCLDPNCPAFPADYKPQSSPGALPDLPAYVLFLCFRHADHCGDEPRARALLDAAIDAIKRVMKVLGLGCELG